MTTEKRAEVGKQGFEEGVTPGGHPQEECEQNAAVHEQGPTGLPEGLREVTTYYAEATATAVKGWELAIADLEALQKQVSPRDRLLVGLFIERNKRRYISFAKETNRAAQRIFGTGAESDDQDDG